MTSVILHTPFPKLVEPSAVYLPVTLQDFAAQFKQEMFKNFKESRWDLDRLTQEEHRVLSEVSTYPEFSEKLLVDAPLRELFFKCCLRDKLPIRMVVLYPELCRKIQEIALNRRLNLVFKEMIQVCKDGQEVTIPIAASLKDPAPKRYNLLTPYHPIQLGGVSFSISQIFDHFLNKKLGKGPCEFDVLNGAIRPWKGYIGLYQSFGHSIDTTKDNWWEELEPFKKMTYLETTQFVKAGICREDERESFDLDRTKAVLRVVSTTSTAELTVLNNHALLEVVIPASDGGWNLYPFGSFPRYFPKKFTELFSFFYHGDKGDIRYPDQSNLIAGKVQHSFTFVVTEKVALNVLRVIGRKIELSNSPSLDGRFHVRHHSCAQWVKKVLEEGLNQEIPDFLSANSAEVDADHLFNKAILEGFERTVWFAQVCYWNQLGEKILLPVALNRRHMDPDFSSLIDLSPTD